MAKAPTPKKEDEISHVAVVAQVEKAKEVPAGSSVPGKQPPSVTGVSTQDQPNKE